MASRLTIEGIALEMLAEVARARTAKESGRPRWLAAAVELLREEFHRNLTLEQVAAEVDVHPAHLSRVFRAAYRQTLGECLNQFRVRFAMEQLAGEIPLSDLALAAGFADQSHFTRVFCGLTGTTPGRFRLLVQKRR